MFIQKLFLYMVFSVLVMIILMIYSSLDYKKEETPHWVKKCGRFPHEKDIFIDNMIWQVMEHPKGFVKIYNAYLDRRFNKTIVKVNVNGPLLSIKLDKIYCQFWLDADTVEPIIVRAVDFQLMMWQRE